MFNDAVVATTALSSFNNAALYSPFFFVVGLFMLPLLFVVYLYSNDFVLKFGLRDNTDDQIGFFSALFLALWLMLFGGNYAVMRDGISLLPVLIAVVLFCLMGMAAQKCVQLGYINKVQNKKTQLFLFVALMVIAGFSAMPTWWGILLQISAVLCGIIVGCRTKRNLRLITFLVLVLTLVVVLVLMQPEFFRFGQLGNLTIIHLLAVMFAGFCAITVFMTRYIRPRGKIHHSAYIKLKWLFRIILLLAFVLLISTESVPVFVGLVSTIGLLEALSIYHSKNIPENMQKQSCAILLMCVGAILICPVLMGLGILYWATIDRKANMAEFLKLL